MVAGSRVPFETLVELIEQLSPAQQRQLMARLQARSRGHTLSPAEKMALIRSVQADVAVIHVPSVRREDWYDDTGR